MSNLVKKCRFFELKYIIPLFMFVLAFFVRLLLFFRLENYFPKWEDIPASKILEAKLPESFADIWATVFPVYPSLCRFAFFFCDNYIFTAPWVSLFFGVLSVLIFFYMAKKWFGLECAFFSAVLLSFYPVHLIQSVLSTEMTLFLTVIFLQFIFFYDCYANKKSRYFFALVAIMNLAHLIRPESWILGNIIIISFIVLVSWKKGLLLGFLGNLVVFYNVLNGRILDYILSQEGTFFYELAVLRSLGKEESLYSDVWVTLCHNLLPFWLVLLAVLGCFFAVKDKKYRPFIASLLMLLLLYFMKISSFTMHPHPRYFSLVVFLLVPFAFFALGKLIRMKSLRLVVEGACVLYLVFYFLNFNFFLYNEEIPSFVDIGKNSIKQPFEVTQVVGWIDENISKESKILIDHPQNPRLFLSIAAYLSSDFEKIEILLPENPKTSGISDIFEKKFKNNQIPDVLVLFLDGFFLKNSKNFLSTKTFGGVVYRKNFSGFGCQIWVRK